MAKPQDIMLGYSNEIENSIGELFGLVGFGRRRKPLTEEEATVYILAAEHIADKGRAYISKLEFMNNQKKAKERRERKARSLEGWDKSNNRLALA